MAYLGILVRAKSELTVHYKTVEIHDPRVDVHLAGEINGFTVIGGVIEPFIVIRVMQAEYPIITMFGSRGSVVSDGGGEFCIKYLNTAKKYTVIAVSPNNQYQSLIASEVFPDASA